MIIAVKFGKFTIQATLEAFHSTKLHTFSTTFSAESAKKEHSQKKKSEDSSTKPMSNTKETLTDLPLKKC